MSSSVNFIYNNCPVCDKVGKSLACCDCMKKNIQGFLVLEEGHIRIDKKKQASLMFLTRNLQMKLKRYQQLQEEVTNYKCKAAYQISACLAGSKLKSNINYLQTCNTRLKLIIANQLLELQNQKRYLQEMKKEATLTQKRIEKIVQKKVKLKDYTNTKEDMVKNLYLKHEKVKREVTNQKKQHIYLLRQYIFPIHEVKELEDFSSLEDPYEAAGSGDKEKSLLQEELDEARRLSFVNGRWIDQQVGSSDIFQISVAVDVASAPSDGDYSSYVSWLEKNHNTLAGTSTTTSTEYGQNHQPLEHSVFRISAALGHVAQMMLVIRKILAIHLPHRIKYSAYCNPSISPKVFINAIKLLNCNIVSVCLQQGVDGSALHPLHTLRNLQILTEYLIKEKKQEDLIVPDVDVLESMEETLVIADMSDEESEEETDGSSWSFAIESDWLPLFTTDLTSKRPSIPTYTSITGQSSVLSQPTGLVSSAFNWAKGWWAGEQ